MEPRGIKVAGLVEESITDGPGIRFTVFVQGCPRRCEGCHNPSTWDFAGGREMQAEEIFAMMRRNPLVRGITFSGGEPLCQAEALLPLARLVRDGGYELAIYTGYLFEELMAGTVVGARELLDCADILVDGPFVLARRDLSLKFRGSSNQRILNLPRSLLRGKVVEDASPRWSGA